MIYMAFHIFGTVIVKRADKSDLRGMSRKKRAGNNACSPILFAFSVSDRRPQPVRVWFLLERLLFSMLRLQC
jgi:hypothetical protein